MMGVFYWMNLPTFWGVFNVVCFLNFYFKVCRCQYTEEDPFPNFEMKFQGNGLSTLESPVKLDQRLPEWTTSFPSNTRGGGGHEHALSFGRKYWNERQMNHLVIQDEALAEEKTIATDLHDEEEEEADKEYNMKIESKVFIESTLHDPREAQRATLSNASTREGGLFTVATPSFSSANHPALSSTIWLLILIFYRVIATYL